MKAIVFEKTGDWQEVLQLKEVELPEPADDEIQVEIKARPINPSDEMFINGVYRRQPQLPQIAGLEGAGVVVKSKKDPSLIGKQVAFRAPGTWAEKINLGKNQFIIVPDSISPAIACQLSLNTLTAFALLEEAKINKEEWLLITAAAGTVAKQLIQLALFKGIKTIAVVRGERHKQRLLSTGATGVINTENESLVEATRSLAPQGVKAAIDAIGGSTGSSLYKVMAPFGTIIVYGRLGGDPVEYDNADIIYRNLTVKGFGIDAWIENKTAVEIEATWQELIGLVENEKIKVPVDYIRTLDGIDVAIAEYKTTSAKVILVNNLN